ncbi:hypothetical protein A3J44_02495 [candidate division WOR-1 bacterium RIFCSPHIGHO2_02_FULL_45_12]|uniref:DUF5723 domain-containing protein n=1 Tax=candidate division WOR-1 bacterium RIFCSPLOWO2_12_FULL_45_9 TaxID=1802568 RepID=A0A1F4RJL1_UNCSA|nr:MAG: hypothetical protein A3J44_02495 [candidate division WOR-1 bacterium RIFCSPHIGHO2_02_FULL_45_12]OGC08375.1 MAG: hypothetical protein A3F86_01940 [candidate division WOR-1 bacterium RIFCSPLOWO2_12_FULL_45_9]
MKKLFAAMLLVSLLASFSHGLIFIGSKQAGMGGTGVASAIGLNAVAYNPAGMLGGPNGELLLSLGAVNQGLDQVVNSLTAATSPAQFMVDNYNNVLNANGTLSGILGINAKQIGISVLLPSLQATLSKPATGTIAGSFSTLGEGAVILTLGHTFTTPGLPIASLDVGLNAKYVYAALGSLTIGGNPLVGTNVTATQTYWIGNGTGFDLGAKTSVAVPAVADFKVGIAMRNIAQSVKYTPSNRTDTYTGVATGAPTLTTGTEILSAETTATAPAITTIGCAGTIPSIGLEFAADIESISGGTGPLAVAADTVTHLGLEYPLLARTLILRAGTASGQSSSVSTIGAKINIPFVTLEIANVIDNKNALNTSYVLDAGVAF